MSPLMGKRGSCALLGNLERPIFELPSLVTMVVLVLTVSRFGLFGNQVMTVLFNKYTHHISGQNCEKDISITKPYFSEESFIAFPRPKHILRALKLSFKFNAEDAKDAILVSS